MPNSNMIRGGKVHPLLSLFGFLTCNSRFAVAEQVCAWQAPLAPPAPPAALPEWELTCGGSIQRSSAPELLVIS